MRRSRNHKPCFSLPTGDGDYMDIETPLTNPKQKRKTPFTGQKRKRKLTVEAMFERTEVLKLQPIFVNGQSIPELKIVTSPTTSDNSKRRKFSDQKTPSVFGIFPIKEKVDFANFRNGVYKTETGESVVNILFLDPTDNYQPYNCVINVQEKRNTKCYVCYESNTKKLVVDIRRILGSKIDRSQLPFPHKEFIKLVKNKKNRNLWCVDCIKKHNKSICDLIVGIKAKLTVELKELFEEEKKKLMNTFPDHKKQIEILLTDLQQLKEENSDLKMKMSRPPVINEDLLLSDEYLDEFAKLLVKQINNDIEKQRYPQGRDDTPKGRERKRKKFGMRDIKNFTLNRDLHDKRGNILFKVLTRIYNRDLNADGIHKVKVMINTILSITYKVVNCKYNSKQNVLVGLIVNQLVNSDLIKVLLNHIGVSNSVTNTKDFIQENANKKRGKTFNRKLKDEDFAVIWVLDNIQRLIRRSSVSNDKVRKFTTDVFTNLGYFVSNLTVNQMNKCTREHWKYEKLPELKENPEKLYKVEEDKIISNKFIIEEFNENLCHVREEKKFFTPNEKGDVVSKFAGKTRDSELKYCPDCLEKATSNRQRKCKKEGCGGDLVLVKDLKIQLEEYEESLVQSKLKIFREMEKNEKKEDRKLSEENLLKKKKKEKEDNIKRLEKHSKKIYIVQGVEVNPGSLKGLNICFDRITRHQKNTMLKLKIVFLDGDPSAKMLNLIILDPQGKWCNYVVKNGGFHTKKCFFGIFCDYLVDVFPDLLISIGWTTPAQFKLVKGVQDMHKVLEIYSILKNAFIKEYIWFYCQKNDVDVDDKDLDGKVILDWLEQYYVYHKENSFQWFMFKTLMHCMMLHKGSRFGGAEGLKMMESSVRLLLPTVFATLHTHYQKILLVESVEMEIMVKELAQELKNMSLCMCRSGLKTQELDGSWEEMNKLLKGLVNSYATYRCWVHASILFEDLLEVKAKGFDTFLLKNRFRENKQASHILHEFYVRRYLRKNNFFDKQFSCHYRIVKKKKTLNVVDVEMENVEELLESRMRDCYKKVIDCMIKKKAISLSRKGCEKLCFAEVDEEEEDEEMNDEEELDWDLERRAEGDEEVSIPNSVDDDAMDEDNDTVSVSSSGEEIMLTYYFVDTTNIELANDDFMQGLANVDFMDVDLGDNIYSMSNEDWKSNTKLMKYIKTHREESEFLRLVQVLSTPVQQRERGDELFLDRKIMALHTRRYDKVD